MGLGPENPIRSGFLGKINTNETLTTFCCVGPACIHLEKKAPQFHVHQWVESISWPMCLRYICDVVLLQILIFNTQIIHLWNTYTFTIDVSQLEVNIPVPHKIWLCILFSHGFFLNKGFLESKNISCHGGGQAVQFLVGFPGFPPKSAGLGAGRSNHWEALNVCKLSLAHRYTGKVHGFF